MSVRYREFAPHPELRDFVECFWTGSISATDHNSFSRVVPDGSADIIIDVLGGSVGVVGTMTRAKIIPHRDAMELVAVRFRPGGAVPFLNVPMHELTNARVRLDICDTLEGDGLIEQMQRCDASPARVELLQAALRGQIGRGQPADPMVIAAGRRITQARGRVEIAHLADEIGVGTRRLQRRFRHHVGISPKQLARILRIRSVTDNLHRLRTAKRASGRSPDWLGLVAQAGFFDQAHFIHEFKRITGVTPGDYVRE